jgi:hypothetical protein
LVYGTGYGGLTATVDFLEGVAARGAEYGSPTSFHQSVHHAAAGQISIALGMRALCLTASSREISGESALKVGIDLIRMGRATKVLVVAADEVMPALVTAYRAFDALAQDPGPMKPGHLGIVPGEGAAAVLLAKNAAPGEIRATVADVLLGAHPVPGLRLPAKADLLLPMLRRAASSTPSFRVFAAACGTEAEAAEAEAISTAAPNAAVEHLAPHLGFNPSGGLLRVVASIVLQSPHQATLVHGIAFGGGQAAVRIHPTKQS